jgi:hypothetical protein
MESEIKKSPNATLRQAAEFLQVSERSVQNYQTRGLLNTVYFGKKRFFKWAELERLARRGVAKQ